VTERLNNFAGELATPILAFFDFFATEKRQEFSSTRGCQWVLFSWPPFKTPGGNFVKKFVRQT
jgi:hypothetical protein